MGRSIEVPKIVEAFDDANEILRVWGAHGEQHVTLDVIAWNAPIDWGMFLADLVRHTAIAFGQQSEIDAEQALALIKERMDLAWDEVS